jgi:hypothetical protein
MNAKLLILRAAANVSPTNGVNLRESSFVHYGVLKYRLEQSRPLAPHAAAQSEALLKSIVGILQRHAHIGAGRR